MKYYIYLILMRLTTGLIIISLIVFFRIVSNVANLYVLSIVQIITNVQILSNSYVIWEFVDRKLNIFQVCLGLVYPISFALNNPCRNHLIVHLIVLWMIQQLINLSRCLSCCYCPVSRSTIETFNQNIIELRLRTLDFLLIRIVINLCKLY